MQLLKIGGNELDSVDFLAGLGAFVAQASEPMILVHGGGQAIAHRQTQLGLDRKKVDGLRVTDAASMDVVEMVLSGTANKLLVKTLLAAGVNAIGLSGVDGNLLHCQKKAHPTADLGFVGETTAVNAPLLHQLLKLTPALVISPVSLDPTTHQSYNVNADEAASAIAAALDASLLTFVSNVPGVLENGRLHPHLTPQQTETLIANGVITDGMIPKARAALNAVAKGVNQARITNLAGLQANTGTIFSL
jgi:acetylglutamate kinase